MDTNVCRHNYKSVIVRGRKKVANTINWLTKTARKARKQGNLESPKITHRHYTFIIIYRERWSGLAYLTAARNALLYRCCGRLRLTDIEF